MYLSLEPGVKGFAQGRLDDDEGGAVSGLSLSRFTTGPTVKLSQCFMTLLGFHDPNPSDNIGSAFSGDTFWHRVCIFLSRSLASLIPLSLMLNEQMQTCECLKKKETLLTCHYLHFTDNLSTEFSGGIKTNTVQFF